MPEVWSLLGAYVLSRIHISVVFSHGWPLTADVWDGPANFVASQGLRAIAHDRRGGGRSSQPWDGNDLDHYADDLASVIEYLDLHDIVLVGHSTGGGEVTRYIGRHGTVSYTHLDVYKRQRWN